MDVFILYGHVDIICLWINVNLNAWNAFIMVRGVTGTHMGPHRGAQVFMQLCREGGADVGG